MKARPIDSIRLSRTPQTRPGATKEKLAKCRLAYLADTIDFGRRAGPRVRRWPGTLSYCCGDTMNSRILFNNRVRVCVHVILLAPLESARIPLSLRMNESPF